MASILSKLNSKDIDTLFIVDAPESFLTELKEAGPDVKVVYGLPEAVSGSFILGFCTKLQQVDDLATRANAILTGDGLLWIAYPKGSSKKYTCEFNRDNGWETLGKLGFEPVRQVAIDEDWSALRFRRVEFIKKMTRSFAMTEEGKKKTRK